MVVYDVHQGIISSGAELYAVCGGVEAMVEKVKFYNVYGLTEQSVWSSMYRINPQLIMR